VAAEAWHRRAGRLVGCDACLGWVPSEFPPGSRRRAHIPDRNPSTVARMPLTRHGRNSRGTEWGLSRNRHPSGASRMGTEWGLGRFTDPADNRRRDGDRGSVGSRLRGATAVSPPAAGLGHQAEIRGKAGAAVRGRMPNERSERRGALHVLPRSTQGLNGGGEGIRTPVPKRPPGSSTGVACGFVSPGGSRRRKSAGPASLRCPRRGTRRTLPGKPARDARPADAGNPRRTATY
jgi:hypothetical protein